MNQPKHQGQGETQNRSVIWETMQWALRLWSQRKQLDAPNVMDSVMHTFLFSTIICFKRLFDNGTVGDEMTLGDMNSDQESFPFQVVNTS